MNELALFSGVGGGILGGKLLGWRTVCAVEIEPFRCERLAQRQNEGFLPPFPIWCGPIESFHGRPWRGLVDVVSGGFPCQDISAANPNAVGLTGARSGLWKEMLRIIREVGPAYVLVENSPRLCGLGLNIVLSDLAGLGYDARWGVLGADDIHGFHRRERLFIVGYTNASRLQKFECVAGDHGQELKTPVRTNESVAYADELNRGTKHGQPLSKGGGTREQPSGRGDPMADMQSDGRGEGRPEQQGVQGRPSTAGSGEPLADANRDGKHEPKGSLEEFRQRTEDRAFDCLWRDRELIVCRDGKVRATKPGLHGMAYGVPDRVERISAIGDAQVPAVVAAIWQILTASIGDTPSST